MLEKISENYTSSESYFDITREVHTFSGLFLFYSKKYNFAINKLY